MRYSLSGLIVPGYIQSTWLFVLFLAFIACGRTKEPTAQEIVDRAIQNHGMTDIQGKTIQFSFRDREYSVSREAYRYVYTRSWEDDSLGYVKDVLLNSSQLTRTIDGDTVELSEEWATKYASSVNSVLYFFQIPLVLNDPGAIKSYSGKFSIEGEVYWAVEVTFQEEGGGEDYDDVFIYWIHEDQYTVDYLAYLYRTEGGGIRFRKAINRREVNGVVIQDYINYKADKGIRLADLPQLYTSGKLEELSRIINEQVTVQSN